MKTLSKAVALASLVSASALTAQAANAEVEYSAQIDSMYLYRGQDNGTGGLISASIDYSHDSGLYAGAWVASAPEYDLYVGYYMEAGDVEVDVSLASYAYSDAGDDTAALGEEIEAILSLSYMGANFTYFHGLEALEDNSYITLGYEVAGIDLTYGMADSDGAEYSHIDASYGLSEELSLTVSQTMDDNAGAVEDLQVLVSYTLPIK